MCHLVLLGLLAIIPWACSRGVGISGTFELDKLQDFMDGNGPLKGKIDLHVNTGGETGGEKLTEECDPLKTLLADFVINEDWKTALEPLKNTMIVHKSVDEIWDWVKRRLGVDLTNGAERDRLACLAYKASAGDKVAIEELSPIFNKSSHAYIIYEYTFELMIEADGYDGMVTMAAVIREYADWMGTTGYPKVPMSNLGTEQDLVARFKDWQDRIKGIREDGTIDRGFVRLTSGMFLNWTMKPEDIAKAIISAESTLDLLTDLGNTEKDYEVFRKSVSPPELEAMAHLFERFIKIAQEVTRLGLI